MIFLNTIKITKNLTNKAFKCNFKNQQFQWLLFSKNNKNKIKYLLIAG